MLSQVVAFVPRLRSAQRGESIDVFESSIELAKWGNINKKYIATLRDSTKTISYNFISDRWMALFYHKVLLYFNTSQSFAIHQSLHIALFYKLIRRTLHAKNIGRPSSMKKHNYTPT